ncbi:hypothetical protein [Geopsychrobacter electrodiphilus]|uniref:hypothetical protein n=1 Tax=Geopsychrobacter electrodiphilus TaxID=225196 RepID=UPI0003823D4F|nr:hypothetical protein [Geopsychrobacter electrodiphilus]
MQKIMFFATMFLTVVIVAAAPATICAADMAASQQKLLEDTGIPVYPEASFTTGDDSVASMLWFKSKDSPEKIMDWYEEKLSGWSVLLANGTKVLYLGPKGKEAKDLLTLPHIWARTTDETPGSKDSEITIRIPK